MRAVRILGLIAVAAVSLGAGPSLSIDGEDQLLASLHTARADRGLPRLNVDSGLTAIARSHSVRMAEAGVLFHNANVARETQAWASYAENVASGTSVSAAEKALMDSSTHRANILDSGFDDVGMGVAWSGGSAWVTQVFAVRAAPAPPPTTVPVPTLPLPTVPLPTLPPAVPPPTPLLPVVPTTVLAVVPTTVLPPVVPTTVPAGAFTAAPSTTAVPGPGGPAPSVATALSVATAPAAGSGAGSSSAIGAGSSAPPASVASLQSAGAPRRASGSAASGSTASGSTASGSTGSASRSAGSGVSPAGDGASAGQDPSEPQDQALDAVPAGAASADTPRDNRTVIASVAAGMALAAQAALVIRRRRVWER